MIHSKIYWSIFLHNAGLFGVAPLCGAVNATLPPTVQYCIPSPVLPFSSDITLGTGPGSLWAATLDRHSQAPKHFPRAVAEGLGLPGVDWLPGALDSGQQCVNPGSKPPDHSYPLPALGT